MALRGACTAPMRLCHERETSFNPGQQRFQVRFKTIIHLNRHLSAVLAHGISDVIYCMDFSTPSEVADFIRKVLGKLSTTSTMPGQLTYVFLTSLLIILVATISVPQSTDSHNANPGLFQDKTGLGVCDPPPTPLEIRPSFYDCQEAIQHRLPHYPGEATFHWGGDDDGFRLPISVHSGSCNITVVMGGVHGVAGGDLSSWLDIKRAATEVNEVCRVGEHTGGKIMTGLRNMIWIKLGKVDFRGLVEGGMYNGSTGNAGSE